MIPLDLPACVYIGGVTYEGSRQVIRPGAPCSVRFDDEGVNLYDQDGALFLWDWSELAAIEVRGDDIEQSGSGVFGRKGKGEPAKRCWLAIGLADGREAEIQVPQSPRVVRAAVDDHLLAVEEASEAAAAADAAGLPESAGPDAPYVPEAAPAGDDVFAPPPAPEPPPGALAQPMVPLVALSGAAADEALATRLAALVPHAQVMHLAWFGPSAISAAAVMSHALAHTGRVLVLVGADDREQAVRALAAAGGIRPLRWLEVDRFDPPQIDSWVLAQTRSVDPD